MQFVNVPFPERIAFGAMSEPAWRTLVNTNAGGYDTTNQDWEDTLHHFDVSFAVRTVSAYREIRVHFHVARGRSRFFIFRDPLDHDINEALLELGVFELTSDGYQMQKRYGTGADAYDRKITRPLLATIAVYRLRSGSTTNATADATIDDETGLVTMANDVGGDTYTWAGEFSVPCRYDIDRLPGLIVNKEPGEDGELYVQCDSIPIVEVRE